MRLPNSYPYVHVTIQTILHYSFPLVLPVPDPTSVPDKEGHPLCDMSLTTSTASLVAYCPIAGNGMHQCTEQFIRYSCSLARSLSLPAPALTHLITHSLFLSLSLSCPARA